MTAHVGKIACPLSCSIPNGITATEVPPPRHDWADVKRCPNGPEELGDAVCGKTFLISATKVDLGDVK